MNANRAGLRLGINAVINEMQLRDAIVDADNDVALEAILAIDLAIADAGFTETLIKRLAASLRGDMEPAEFDALIAEIAGVNA